MNQQELDVAGRVKELRLDRELSLRALAERSGLNVNTLSMIENRKNSPSISTLQSIAAALNCPLTDFFVSSAPKVRVVHQRQDDRSRARFDHGYMEDLGDGMISQRAQPIIVSLNPYAESGEIPIVHTGQEFVYCLDGEIQYIVEDEEYRLKTGDSLLFEAHLPHRWHNLSSSPARILLVLCPADERDQPTQRHFGDVSP
jgi:transcriptional regulator with XRE-family HTH domain